MFDIFLACAPKDFNKLPYVTKSIVDNVRGFDKMVICSPVDVPPDIQARIPYAFYNYLDQTLLPGVDRSKWNYRPNWHFQQYLKLFQLVTSDWYLTWDCDTIACREISFYENGKPIYYYGWEQNHAPYFRFQEKMIGISRVGPHTFISDLNFIYRPIIREILENNGYTLESFIQKAQSITGPNCYMAECELYGSFAWEYHSDMFVFKKLEQKPFDGRIHKSENTGYVYSEKEIESAINENKDKGYDTLSLHSWYIEKGIECP